MNYQKSGFQYQYRILNQDRKYYQNKNKIGGESVQSLIFENNYKL